MAALLTLFRHAAAPPVGDAELLDRFAVSRDEDAFAELVRRHGPVVLRVCRRLVGPDAAEDAFQAAFLVLATRPDAARTSASVGGWLVGVAGRVARQMRRAAMRRTHYETASAVSRSETPSDTPEFGDQFAILDEEIARLPARLRDPVVLCLLQGRTQEQAAAELGRDARTLRRRLGRAKQVLRARLERRGVVPVVTAALLSGAGAAAAVPAALATRTTATVFDFLTGGATRSVPVVLAKGVAMTTFPRKLTHLLTVAAAGLLGVGVLVAGDENPKPVPAAVLASPPKTADDKKPAGEEKMILIQSLCFEVEDGLCGRCGFDDPSPWVLTPRELKMLSELIRTAKDREILSRPQLIVTDNQTGFVQVGQQVPLVVLSEEKKEKDGRAVNVQQVKYENVGLTLRVTPRVSADGRSVVLHAETQSTQVSPQPADLGNGVKSAVINSQTCQTTVVLPVGGTSLIRAATTKQADGTVREQLWLLTPHIVRTKEQLPVMQPGAKLLYDVTVPPPTLIAPQPLPMAKPTPVKP